MSNNDKEIEDIYKESYEEWRQQNMTKTLVNILEALKMETQDKYKETTNNDQFQYIRGLEIGYVRSLEVITEEMKDFIKIDFKKVPVIIR